MTRMLKKIGRQKKGKDFTCPDTLCKSYVKKASTEVGSDAAGREDKKVEKYNNLSDNYYFVVVGVKIYGAYGFQGIKLIKQEATGEKLSIFISYKVSRWQYNKTTLSALWVAQN